MPLSTLLAEVERWVSKAQNYTADDWYAWAINAGNEHIVLRLAGGLLLFVVAIVIGCKASGWRKGK